MKQTAVEWFADKIQEQLDVFLPGAVLDNKMVEQAKAMEKAEKDKQYQRGFKDGSKHIKIIYKL